MKRKATLITTDSYFNAFGILNELIKGKTQGVGENRNLVFCEEKISLMAERWILNEAESTFNTDVYSFGNYIRKKKQFPKTLSKEGSAMAIRKILSGLSLQCFRGNKSELAVELYELISQLKSANVSPEQLREGASGSVGALKRKLNDIYSVYDAYEKFLSESGFCDQSALLNDLPKVILSDESLKRTDVYLLCQTSLTGQERKAVGALIEAAKSVTAVLTDGKNRFAFVGETAEAFRKICKQCGAEIEESFVPSDYSKEGKTILNELYLPQFSKDKIQTEKIFVTPKKSTADEVYSVAETIKKAVIEGKARYKDFTIGLSDAEEYANEIRKVFGELGIPFFLDERKNPVNHPLARLVLDYYEALRKNNEQGAVLAFALNPIISEDKSFSDAFSEYVKKYNVNYDRFFRPFVFGGEQAEKFEPFRRKTADLLNSFNVFDMLAKTDAENRVKELGDKLSSAGSKEEYAINEQIYEKIKNLLDEQELLLGGIELGYSERKNIFLSGLAAMKLSILPQYNDAVFVGEYKETALAKAKYLFLLGLTSQVPLAKADVALLTDNDISRLEELKVLVEPKIKIVNARERENAAMAVVAFEERLFLSYPESSIGGKPNEESVIVGKIKELFNCKTYRLESEYLTEKQGAKSFARAMREFINGERTDFKKATAFYYACKNRAKPLLERNNAELKIRVDGKGKRLIGGETAPTTIEKFYKCPYLAFCERTLRLKEEDKGEISPLNVGNIVHEIVEKFVKKVFVEKTAKVENESDCRSVCEKIAKEIIQEKQEYRALSEDEETGARIEAVIDEAKKYCVVCYNQIKHSEFKPKKVEAKIGGANADYPAVEFLNGEVKLTGKIDRVDEFNDYFRIIDYKTGAIDETVKGLYSGQKLQLYLYSKAVTEGRAAGLYYMDLENSFKKSTEKEKSVMIGKTLAEAEIVQATDQTATDGEKGKYFDVKIESDGSVKNGISEETMNAFTDYAYLVAEKGVRYMTDGVIAPLPIEGSCERCKYFALCDGAVRERKISSVNAETVTNAVEGKKSNE